MRTRLRTTGLAGASGALLVLVMSGVVAAGGLITTASRPAAEVTDPVPDTSATWEDVDGNGIDDDCEAVPAVADPTAAGAADAAVDTDADGTLSTSEAAQSARIGGKNCNHGGYVSVIAKAGHECADSQTPPATDPQTPDDAEPVVHLILAEDDQGGDAEPGDNEQGDQGDDAEEASQDGDAPTCTDATAATFAADHDAAKDARTAAHDAAKAQRAAERAARKAEKAAAREAKQLAKQAAHADKHAKSAKSHGKGHAKTH